MNLAVRRPGGGHAGTSLGLVVPVAACVLALGTAAGCRAPATAPSPPAPHSTYTLLQMNLCLSGLAGCYEATSYPAVVHEAVALVQQVGPDAVTVTEACRRDVTQMARRLDYEVRFARVAYDGAPLRCVDPGGRGLFGNAVLTRAAVVDSRSGPFAAQADLEERRWMCVRTRSSVAVDVCTAHLETPHSRAATAARDAQCAELARILAARSSRLWVLGGDVNRLRPCAPAGAWSRTDGAADKAPGIQHVYGADALRSPTAEVLPAAFSDHDALVVRTRLTPP